MSDISIDGMSKSPLETIVEVCSVLSTMPFETTIESQGLEEFKVNPNLCKLPIKKQTDTILDLRCRYITPKQCEEIATLIKNSTTLTSIDLSANHLGDVGIAIIAQALESPTCRVTVLNLSDNLIGDVGVVALATSLAVNKSVTALDLGDNTIEDCGIIEFTKLLATNLTIRSINLNNNIIRDIGAAHIANAIVTRNWINVYLDDNCIGDSGGYQLAWAIRFSDIENLSLCFNHFIGLVARDTINESWKSRRAKIIRDIPINASYKAHEIQTDLYDSINVHCPIAKKSWRWFIFAGIVATIALASVKVVTTFRSRQNRK